MTLNRTLVRTDAAKLKAVGELQAFCETEAANLALARAWRSIMGLVAKRLALALADAPRAEPVAPVPALGTVERATLHRLARELRDQPHARGDRMATVSWHGSPAYMVWVDRFLHCDGPPAVAACAEALLAALSKTG
jgi:hypothetical protein